MTIYQALRILAPEMKLYFTDFKIGDRFDNERAQASNRSSQVYDPFSDDHGKIFSDGLHYKNIILLKEDGSVFVKEEFTPTQKERVECAKYYATSISWMMTMNSLSCVVTRQRGCWRGSPTRWMNIS